MSGSKGQTKGEELANEWADECVVAEAALAIDVALRRAKAEGVRRAIEELGDAVDYSAGATGTENDKKAVAVNIFIKMAAVHLHELAAQIEEGEDLK